MDIRITPIEADYFYHIYNRGINGEVIFKTERNYQFFLNKLKENLLTVSDIYAYCLMPNHFHLLVKIKDDKDLNEIKIHKEKHFEKGLHASQNSFSKQFAKIFNSYSQAFNKENNRHGSLIESPFKRKLITSEDYLRQCIIYIHQNPNSGGFQNYKYSSYKTILSNSLTSLKRNEVIEMFEDRENFIICHQKETDYQF
ncbi:transposase [Chryseobacterium sp. C-71]|uniref:transposase n=1 Tax=Chryseobacterium sp. C-71 TaxID=2893882 RepID=UPI001E2C7694|nr:transposase [Chryseobacterium sp. C-71]UFH31362.1 transposase [Chryseobacterium sp. C-71]